MQQKTEKKFFHVDISASDLAALNSQLRRKYFWPAVNVVKKCPEVLPITKRDFFEINCLHSDQ